MDAARPVSVAEVPVTVVTRVEPRYTSYPPATKFTPDLSWSDLAERIIENNRTERDLSLYFHLPFCQTLCWFCGCTTVITADQKKSGDYLKYLEREMDLMKPPI